MGISRPARQGAFIVKSQLSASHLLPRPDNPSQIVGGGDSLDPHACSIRDYAAPTRLTARGRADPLYQTLYTYSSFFSYGVDLEIDSFFYLKRMMTDVHTYLTDYIEIRQPSSI